MRFLTSLNSNIPKTGYLFKFKEKNRFWGHPQGGRVGYTQIFQKFLKAYSQTYTQKLPELLSLASVLLAKRRMLTCHEGKGWGFQAGVLKGDFANFKAKLSDKNMQMRFWLTNKRKKSTHKKSTYKKVPTKKYLQKSTY